jgi:large subunit ribosomal protein L9
MPRSVATALACLLLGETANALTLSSGRPSAVVSNARVAPTVMMAKDSATKKMISIFLEADVEDVGLQGEIVEMKAAFAENTIVRKGLGSKATSEQIRQAEVDKLAKEAAFAAAKKTAEEAKQMIASRFGNKGLVIERMFTVQGEMSGGAVTSKEVSDLLQSKGIAVEPTNVVMDPIETIGGSVVAAIELHPDVTTTIKVVLQKSKITIS